MTETLILVLGILTMLVLLLVSLGLLVQSLEMLFR